MADTQQIPLSQSIKMQPQVENNQIGLSCMKQKNPILKDVKYLGGNFEIFRQHRSFGCSLSPTMSHKIDKKDIINRADQSIRELSESNRLQSRQKIKKQEMEFRIRLKMSSILRYMKVQEKQIKQMQELQTSQLLMYFETKLKNLLKENNRAIDKIHAKNEQLEKKLKQKQAQLQMIKKQYEDQQKQCFSFRENAKNQLRKYKSQILFKEQEINRLNINLINKQCQLKRKRIVSDNYQGEYLDNKLDTINPQQNEFQKKPYKQQLFREGCLDKQYSTKLKKVIDEWKQTLYKTVDYYENILEQMKSEQ